MDVLDQVNSNEMKPNLHQVEYGYLEKIQSFISEMHLKKYYILILHAVKQVCNQSSVPNKYVYQQGIEPAGIFLLLDKSLTTIATPTKHTSLCPRSTV